ncbi:LLM class flavin-dependent oxidoreductase [Aquihabitans sp. G128]|uniref:LLM class flavin-dependent oxidoreductase n=1 Tax=Aquihabitans sp. G128 TaxID=2849779 RepID=UPI001C219CD7|nr:LLM class flavin-dependent oxidoreductase [Aquihabitans sp. G128]QXC61112.1 LLM class flavin-dependent oxidoreductase [Aquihabitans sp. G128]
MEIGLAFPQMTAGFDRDGVRAWCRAVDEGPFSSISAGERITFDNLDGMTLCASAAALTERVRVLFNVAVAPWHQTALLAKQLASIDVVSGGRVEVAVGVGGREQDYAALGSPFAGRFGRLDDAVAELRRLWAGGDAAGGGQVGPTPLRPGGPRILCSGTGPRSLARAAHWADGVSGFTLPGDAAEAGANFRLAERAWLDAGRTERPRLVTGAFVALGPDAEATLQAFGRRYLAVFGERPAHVLAGRMSLHTEQRLADFATAVAAEGADELILVPASNDPALVARLATVVASLAT